MRRGLAFGLLTLGVTILVAPPVAGQTTSAPTTAAPAPTTVPAAGATETTATTRAVRAQSGGRGITAGGEGFPWIPVGVGILVAGLIGSRLRRASRR